MKKFLTTFASLTLLACTANSIFAADGAYKNNLLKVELSKINEDSYNVNLYTQKVYTEPVKVVKKTDTVYYFLLPETSNSVTSVTPVSDISNVMIKTYPYAGQDEKNGYTKVAIITSKPLNLTTTTKAVDSSVSPKLDPVRLAKLDKVFERYAEKLATNNIQSPLIDNKQKTTQATVQKTAQTTVQPAAKTAAQLTSQTNTKPQIKTETKQQQTKTLTNPIQKLALLADLPSQSQSNKATAVNKNNSSANEQTKSNKTTVAGKTGSTSKTTAVKSANNAPKTKNAASKNASAQTAKTPVQVNKETEKQASKTVQTQKTSQTTSEKTVDTSKAVPDTDNEVKKYENELAVKEATDVSFENENTEEVLNENLDDSKSITATVQEQNSPLEENQTNLYLLIGSIGIFLFLASVFLLVRRNIKQKAYNEQIASDNSNIRELLNQRAAENKINQNVQTRPDFSDRLQTEQPQAPVYQANSNVQQNNFAQTFATSASNFEDTYSTTTPVRGGVIPETNYDVRANDNYYEPEILDTIPDYAPTQNNETTSYDNSDYEANYQNQEYDNYDTDKYETNYPEENNIQNESDNPPETSAVYQALNEAPEDYGQTVNIEDEDTMLQELLTPIDSTYSDNNVVADYNSDNQNTNEESATIVSSSKLTETRGLYLAKFEGTTSLVGYIQDDIYVLYNFGDMEVKDTDIESQLAKESDTDSLYIVKTGGKKLMVKSTPYEMSVEKVF